MLVVPRRRGQFVEIQHVFEVVQRNAPVTIYVCRFDQHFHIFLNRFPSRKLIKTVRGHETSKRTRSTDLGLHTWSPAEGVQIWQIAWGTHTETTLVISPYPMRDIIPFKTSASTNLLRGGGGEEGMRNNKKKKSRIVRAHCSGQRLPVNQHKQKGYKSS